MKHTPGPWTAWDDDRTGTLPYVLSKQVTSLGNFYVAQCKVYEDARLIAAAPELYDAVLMLLGCTDLNVDELDETSIEAIELARKAIAKAEGK
jgi:hypothetical protein